jgi:FtsH-binding integral membrane protein
MCLGTIWTFTYKRHIQDINRPIAVVATLLFVLSTAVSFSPLVANFTY